MGACGWYRWLARGRSSVGRALASQARCRGFEPRRPLPVARRVSAGLLALVAVACGRILAQTRRKRVQPGPGGLRGGLEQVCLDALEVADFVAELAETYQIVEAVYDPWRAGQMAQEWEQRGIPAVKFPQSDSRMIPACERLYDAVVHGSPRPSRRPRPRRPRALRRGPPLTPRMAPRQARAKH